MTLLTPPVLNRHKERGSTDRAALDALLDSVLMGTVSTVTSDGMPFVIPMLCARDGDRVLLHGSTGAGGLRALAAGAPAALCVTALDALVVGHTTFASSANYRSAVIYGTPVALGIEERARALDVVSEHLIPGRTREVRPMSQREIAATTVLALPIEEDRYLVKTRTGHASTPDEDTGAWHGHVPLPVVPGTPVPAPTSSAPLPDSVRALAQQFVDGNL